MFISQKWFHFIEYSGTNKKMLTLMKFGFCHLTFLLFLGTYNLSSLIPFSVTFIALKEE